MWNIDKDTLNRLRERFPKGARVELTKMNDPYNTTLTEGCRGTVRAVDDCGTIHVSWDCGSSLGVVYGEDACKIVQECPVCGKTYEGKPAISRNDGHFPICPDCGIREALTASRIAPEEQEKILEHIHQHQAEVTQ